MPAEMQSATAHWQSASIGHPISGRPSNVFWRKIAGDSRARVDTFGYLPRGNIATATKRMRARRLSENDRRAGSSSKARLRRAAMGPRARRSDPSRAAVDVAAKTRTMPNDFLHPRRI